MPNCFTRPIHHGRYRFHLAPLTLRRRPPRPRRLSIGTFNIRNGWGFRITHAIRAVQIGGFDLMILMDTKVNNQAYCHNMMGYDVVFLPAIMP